MRFRYMGESVRVGKIKTLEQHLEDLKPCFEDKGYVFKGQYGAWQGCRTFLSVCCPKHGEWNTTTINRFKSGQGCPKCKSEGATKTDEEHLKDILKSDRFPKNAKFYPKNERGFNWDAVWLYVCPVCSVDEYTKNGLCSGVFETTLSRLKKGSKPCRCSAKFRYTKDQWEYRVNEACNRLGYTFVRLEGKPGVKAVVHYLCTKHGEQTCETSHFLRGVGCPDCLNTDQSELYINLVLDGECPIALKVGISKKSNMRLAQQNSSNVLQMERLFLYKFSTARECRKAEAAIKKNFKSGFLSVSELKDGHTETFGLQYLSDVLSFLEECNCHEIRREYARQEK